MKFKKGDEVLITIGKDAGKRGKVEKVFPKKNKLTVGGLNLYKKHLKPQGQNKPGGIIDIIKPVGFGNIALICPKCNKQTRVGFSIEKDDKIRICRKCGQSIT